MVTDLTSDKNTDHDMFMLWKDFWKENCYYNSVIMRIAFLSPYQSRTVKYSGRLLLGSILMIFLFSSFLRIDKERKETEVNTSIMVESVFQVVAYASILFCFLFMIMASSQVDACMIMMARMWCDNDPEARRVILKFMRIGYYLTFFQAVSLILLCLSFGTAPVVVPLILNWALSGNQTYEMNLPIHTEFFIDEDNYFLLILAFQLCSMIVYGLMIGAMNIFQCGAISFIIGQLQCLQYYFKEIDDEFDRKIVANETDTDIWIYKKLKEVIRRHQKCIRFFELLHDLANPMMFVIIVGASSIIVLTGTWMVILLETDVAGAAKMMCAFCIAIGSIIFICAPSQLMSNFSYDIFIKSYSTNWHTYPPKVRVLLVFTMMRLMEPFVLRAGPTIELNLETCSSIIKSSMSYVTAFRSVYTAL